MSHMDYFLLYFLIDILINEFCFIIYLVIFRAYIQKSRADIL